MLDQQKRVGDIATGIDDPISGRELFDIYKKLFASAIDERICWWYCGTIFIDLPGHLTIPVIQAETAMIYRVETVSPEQFRIHWREIGYFRDPLTGEPAELWTNPLTGQKVKCSQLFEEGPGCTTVTATQDGIEISLTQPFAIVRSVEVKASVEGGRIALAQTERKQRGYPQEDGSLPEPGAEGTSEGITILSIFGSRADIHDDAQNWAASSGSYEFGLSALPPWMGFGDRTGRTTVRGLIHKAAIDQPSNLSAWARLQGFFPDYFEDGRLRDDWC
jgi:hypothetical protein